MPLQEELFPMTSGFRPDTSLEEPGLWVRELRIYRTLSPGEGNLLRRIALRPGLNILWAKPHNRTEKTRLHEPGVSGHATGKTTFCRFVRHLLGEPAFGNDDQRAGLRAVFPEGWIVGEVCLDRESWLVCRPFKIGPHPLVYRGRTIENLFDGDEGKVSFDNYRKRLDEVLAEPLPVTTFATSPVPIIWPHILQWLTRDQECRFAGLADLRHPSSDSEAPEMAAEDRHFLFRAVLGLIDTTEQAELEANKQLLTRRNQAAKDAPLLKFRGDSGLKRLREQLPEFRTDLAGADFLSAVATEWAKRGADLEDRLKTIREPEAVVKARATLVETERSLGAAKQQTKEVSDTLAWIEQQIKNLKGETTDEEMAAWYRKTFPPDRFCGQPLSAAIEWECPLVRDRKLSFEKPSADAVEKPTLVQLEAKKRSEEPRLVKAQAVAKLREWEVEAAKNALQTTSEEFDKARLALSQHVAEAKVLAADASRALADQTEAEHLEKAVQDYDQKIEQSRVRQNVIRQQQNRALSEFSETFGRIARAVLGDDVSGSIGFRGRQLRPALVHDIDLTSAALETLKIICFDLAALVSGVEGRGQHPRFLIHDGPREADMDAALYQRLFLLMAQLEEAFGTRPVSFQYIVTTTEAPPNELEREPWLLSPVLDATMKAGKLLASDF